MVHEYLGSPFSQSNEGGFDSHGVDAKHRKRRRQGNSRTINGDVALEEHRELISMTGEGRNSKIEIALGTSKFAPAPVDDGDPHNDDSGRLKNGDRVPQIEASCVQLA